ncbi:hypothetical protein BGW80DRAFT_700362 [Lactifluus volemus]|nr:hypothetical protein BGW80DRAFT_700362 [Lactifluus volemus]
MSPPLLPIALDPFARDPPGAVVVNRSQVHASRPAVHRPALSMSSVPVPAKHPATHAHTRHNSASQSTNDFSLASAAQRVPRSQHRTDHTKAGNLSTRSRSHPPEYSSVPGHPTTSHSRPPLNPSQVVNLEHTEQHRLPSTHARYPENAFAPRVRGATVTHHNRHHPDTYDSASKKAPHLRKARSSFILSNAPPPVHTPKPLNLSERPNAKRLQMLAESAGRNLSHSNIQEAPVPANVVWPTPLPATPPFQVAMLPSPPPPPRAERDAYRVAAHEADNMRRGIRDNRAYIERIRGDRDRARDREVRRAERDADRQQRSRHHRRAATENSRRPGHGREVEYLSLADYGYLNGSQQWAGATFR